MQGRAVERDAIDAMLREARSGQSTTLLLEGEPGIGKTTLCAYAQSQASGLTVLRAQGVESDSQVSFAGLAQLLGPLGDRLNRLPEPQRAALAGALALGPPTPAPPLTLGAAALSLLAAGADEGPVLAVIDDVHWMDAPSAHTLAFAARRLGRESVAVLFAQRPGEGQPLPTKDFELLRIGPLTADEALRLLNDALGETIAPPVASALVDATAGNPMALLEAMTLLSTAALRGSEPLPDPIALDGDIKAAFRRRLADLPRRTRKALLLLAADATGSIALIAPALGSVGLEIRDFEPAEAARVVVADGLGIRFAHPLVRSAAYHDSDAVERRACHQALAEAAAATDDVERQAWHLAAAATGPDEDVAAALEQAGERAALVGGVAAAAPALERAALLTPPGEARARRLVAAARALFLAGQVSRAAHHVQDARRETTDVRTRAEAVRVEAQLLAATGESPQAVALVRAEFQELAAHDPEQAALMLTEIAVPLLWNGNLDEALAVATEAYELGSRVGGLAELLAMNQYAHMLLFLGNAEAAEPLIWQVYEQWRQRPPDTTLMVPAPATALMYMERYDLAREMVHRSIAEARALGVLAVLPQQLGTLSEIDFATGNWPSAYAAAAECASLGSAIGVPPLEGYGLAGMATVEAVSGRDTECRAHAAAAMEIGSRFGGFYLHVYTSRALALLELGMGHHEEAAAHLEPTVRWLADRGLREPGNGHLGADYVEALVRSGARDQAAQAFVEFESQVNLTGRAWAQAVAHRCRALLADDERAEGHFQAALASHDQAGTPFERARTVLCLGEWLRLRDRNTEAQGCLRSAVVAFERLGAAPWVEKATRGLNAAGGQTDATRTGAWAETLTAKETQVALAVAGGATNKEVAAALFLSAKTVEYHLTNAYRKLRVRSRSELTRLFAHQRLG